MREIILGVLTSTIFAAYVVVSNHRHKLWLEEMGEEAEKPPEDGDKCSCCSTRKAAKRGSEGECEGQKHNKRQRKAKKVRFSDVVIEITIPARAETATVSSLHHRRRRRRLGSQEIHGNSKYDEEVRRHIYTEYYRAINRA